MAIFAIDVDGTTHGTYCGSWPKLGPEVPHAVETMKNIIANGHEIIIYTMRHGEMLADVIKWYQKNRIPYIGINRHPKQDEWGMSSMKAYCDFIIDDQSFGIPLKVDKDIADEPFVDWEFINTAFFGPDDVDSRTELFVMHRLTNAVKRKKFFKENYPHVE